MRLFAAVNISPDLSTQDQIKKQLSDLPLYPVENWHITLHFIGSVADDRLNEIDDALSNASYPAPFDLFLNGIDTFRRKKKLINCHATVGGDMESLHRLYEAVNDVLHEIGFERPERTFHPHVTLARIKTASQRKRVEEIIKGGVSLQSDPMTVDNVALFHSITPPEGPEYSIIRRYPL